LSQRHGTSRVALVAGQRHFSLNRYRRALLSRPSCSISAQIQRPALAVVVRKPTATDGVVFGIYFDSDILGSGVKSWNATSNEP
jgi:hypothetical protein